MEIRKLHIDPERFRPTADTSRVAARRGEQSGAAEGSGGPEGITANQPLNGYDAQLNELVARVRELPEIRPDVVEAARSRLTSGELLTRDAAERTAERIPV
ncbi:hypothetical protein [Maioricimonas sp. JC845]|uniref:hypothetical protein n=1 Tax=Maioricimonas sp. JC845 TaxID=3232138 RepID=UPI003458DCE9